MDNSPPTAKKTTFLTSAHGRPPSAYHVSPTGISQRARQGHGGGAVLTSAKDAVHAFTPDKPTRDVVRANVKDTVRNTGMSTQMALRLEIMDGLASPTASHNDAHQEAFPGHGSTHKSGGYVAFPQSGSTLSNFDTVAQRTQQRSVNPSIPAITDTQSHHHTPESSSFNRQALRAQQAFARHLLGGG